MRRAVLAVSRERRVRVVLRARPLAVVERQVTHAEAPRRLLDVFAARVVAEAADEGRQRVARAGAAVQRGDGRQRLRLVRHRIGIGLQQT